MFFAEGASSERSDFIADISSSPEILIRSIPFVAACCASDTHFSQEFVMSFFPLRQKFLVVSQAIVLISFHIDLIVIFVLKDI